MPSCRHRFPKIINLKTYNLNLEHLFPASNTIFFETCQGFSHRYGKTNVSRFKIGKNLAHGARNKLSRMLSWIGVHFEPRTRFVL